MLLALQMLCEVQVDISVTLWVLHDWVVNPLHKPQPGEPFSILQSGLYPTDLFSLVGPARSTRLPLIYLWGSLRYTVWPLPHRPVQLGWTCEWYKTRTLTDTALGVTEVHSLASTPQTCSAWLDLRVVQDSYSH